jgi:hypothetical protein
LEFEYIDEFLREKGLLNPELEILIPNATLYKALLFQPCGTIEVGDYFVKNQEHDLAVKKFMSFFDLAKGKNVDLAITPEYSCPWEVIKNLIENDVLPKNKKLWVIGCESIEPNELKKIIDENTKVIWIYDDDKVNTDDGGKFLCPICYFLRTEKSNNTGSCDVIFIQFKTEPMGGIPFEIERLLPGEYIYVFRNEDPSIKLATTICSDSLNLEINKVPGYTDDPYLLIHPQLNPNPQNVNFSKYRKDCYVNDFPRKEFICLNWARNSNLNGDIMKFGGSALYTKSDKLDLSDEKINHNHEKGLYYTNWESVHGNIYFFNYDEHIFLFENTKTSQLRASPQSRIGIGPKMMEIYYWCGQNNWCTVQTAVDGFDDLCNNIGGDFSSLSNLKPIDIERLIALSTGLATFPDWYEPKKNKLFYANYNETNKRVTFLHDPDYDIQTEKEKSVTLFGTLNTSIITEEGNFPKNIEDLANNCLIQYNPTQTNPDSYNQNLYSSNAGAPATAVYLGHNNELSARRIFDDVSKLFGDGQTQSGKRVVVWYDDTKRNIVSIFSDTKPNIAENVTISNNSIRKVRNK